MRASQRLSLYRWCRQRSRSGSILPDGRGGAAAGAFARDRIEFRNVAAIRATALAIRLQWRDSARQVSYRPMSQDSWLSAAAPYFAAAAREHNCELSLHPDGGFAGQIRLPDGSMKYFVRSSYDINTAGAWHVARDKALTKYFLESMGYPTIPGRACFAGHAERGCDAAMAYAAEIGFPLMIKVNSSSGGHGVERVDDDHEIEATLRRAFALDSIVVIEQYFAALRDSRVLVLDENVLLAYERRPASVVGDGASTIDELIDRQLPGKPPPAESVERTLARAGLSRAAIPHRGNVVRLLDVANLESGGTALDVSRDRGLRLCGVDLLAEHAAAPRAYIVEINGSPTIHNFAHLCHIGEARLLALYGALFVAMTGLER